MTPAEQAAEAVNAAAKQSGDPVFVGLAWVLGVVIMVLALARPFMGMVRLYQSNKAGGARDGADEALYTQLKQQIELNSKDIRSLIDERNKWQEEALNLKARVNQLEEAEKAIARMKEKLDQKDSLLQQRDALLQQRDDENRRLMLEIIGLKDRLHALELMMAGDPSKFCAECEKNK